MQIYWKWVDQRVIFNNLDKNNQNMILWSRQNKLCGPSTFVYWNWKWVTRILISSPGQDLGQISILLQHSKSSHMNIKPLISKSSTPTNSGALTAEHFFKKRQKIRSLLLLCRYVGNTPWLFHTNLQVSLNAYQLGQWILTYFQLCPLFLHFTH